MPSINRPRPCPSVRHAPLGAGVDLSEDEQAFLRDLVKTSRQKPHVVAWVDRDGTQRQTALSQTDVVRLNKIASGMGVSKGETLRRAAHVPVQKPAGPP